MICPIKYVHLDEFIVMPKHVHGIINLSNAGAGLKPAPAKGHGIAGNYQGIQNIFGREFHAIREYIRYNPPFLFPHLKEFEDRKRG